MHGVRLAWEDLPPRVHGWVEQELGSPVGRATSQPAGFSPGSADRVTAASGRRVFVKAVSSAQNPDTPGLHRREAGVLRSLAEVPGVPRLLGVYDDGDWVALMVEDVEGRHPLLPWVDEELRATLAALAELAAVPPPAGWPALEDELAGEMGCWRRVADDRPTDLDPWVEQRLDALDALAQRTLPRLAGNSVAHTDVRADNLLVQPDGRVRVVDWPWATRGAPWFDAVGLLINVRWAGDLDVRPHLPAIHGLGASRDDVVGLLAGLTGFLTDAARRPPVSGLPTLRRFQREMARAGGSLLQELWEVR